MNNEILKVSSKSNPNAVAGAIAGLITEDKKTELQAIGAGAINQTVRSIDGEAVEAFKKMLKEMGGEE